MHKALLGTLAVLVGTLAAAAPAPATPATPGATTAGSPAQHPDLVLSYDFGGNVREVVTDRSDNGLDGHLVGALGPLVTVPGLPGHRTALTLHGADHQYVDVPLDPALDVDHWTLSAWVRPTGVQNDRTGGRWEVLEKAASYWMNVRTNGLVRVGGFFGGCSGPDVWQFLDSATPVPIGSWTHVAGRYDGQSLSVWIDGVLSASEPVSGRTCVSGEPLAVGAKNNPALGLLEAFWDGELDDVRIYSKALPERRMVKLARR